MLGFMKVVISFIAELIFDSKEEYDFKSHKFNSRKVIAMMIMSLSLVLNIWLAVRFFAVASEYVTYRAKYPINAQFSKPNEGADRD